MDNINNNMNNMDNNNPNRDYTQPEITQPEMHNESGSESFNNLNENDIIPQENIEQKNGYIKIENVKVKKRRFRKAAPFIASILISAIVGGAAGGAYTNYLVNRDKPYTPIAASQENTANPVNYTQPNSLIARVAAEVGPAIVGVDTQVVNQGFFGQKQVAKGSGSGIIYDKSGYILTNQHVIDGSQKITVTLPGGKTFAAKVVGQDPVSDIAVIKINATNLPVAKFGDSSKVRVGDLAIAIGNPMGEEYAGSVTSGIVSALNRSINMNDGDYSRRYKLIQTDAAINPGNSGGALINENGEVIGINSIKFADNNVEGMGFAIPINDAKKVIDELTSHGYVSRPYLGVSVTTITEDMAKEYNCPAGVGIESVSRGSAAEAAGLKPGDVILEIDGKKLTTNDELINSLSNYKVGDSVKLSVWRDGSTTTIPVTLGENKGTTN